MGKNTKTIYSLTNTQMKHNVLNEKCNDIYYLDVYQHRLTTSLETLINASKQI